jgi:hypothetical protein
MRIMAIHMRSQNGRANYHAESQLIRAYFRSNFRSFIHAYHSDVVPGWFFNGLLVQAGVSLAKVSKLLGHSSKVYYNSACPVCNAGIKDQRQRMEACGLKDIEWVDVHTKEPLQKSTI